MICNYAQFVWDKLGDKERADTLYLSALSCDSNDPQTLYRYAIFLEANADYATAERLLRQVVSVNQTHAMALMQLGVIFETLKRDYERADFYYRSAYEADTSNSAVVGAYAHFLHVIKHNFDMAEEMYKKSVELDPEHANNGINYAYFLQHVREEYQAAEALYKQVCVAAADPQGPPSMPLALPLESTFC